MGAYSRNPLTWVWAFLTAITIASWWISHNTGMVYEVNGVITLVVLFIAAIKSRYVIRYFMEVRHAPAWLQRTLDAWLVFLFLMLTGFYATAL